MGDVLEAAGGLIDPWTPAAKPFMMAMHGPHGNDAKNGADAFRSLSGLAQGIKELAGMLPPPKAPGGSKDSNRARIWTILKEFRPDELTLTTARHKGCWICNELTRVGGARLLNEDEEGQATHDEPTRIYSVKKYARFGQGGMLIELGAHLKPRRAWARDTSNGQSANNILQRIPAIILDTRLNDTQNKGTYMYRSWASSRGRPDTCHTRNSPRDGSTGPWTRAGSASIAGQRLNISSKGRAREALELPPASQPAAVEDNRFHQHADRWSRCGNCDCYCTGRATDWLPGSFVYCTDNTPSELPKSGKGCFPRQHGRETLWRNGSWNAKVLCRTCLVQQWQKTPREITERLAMCKPGGSKAASIQRRQWANSGGSGWQGNLSGYVPARHVVGRQSGELEMTPRSSTTHMSREAHVTQTISSRNATNCLF